MNQRKIGVLLSYAIMGTQSLIALIYVPMLLHYLTQTQYGIYQLMGSVIAYLSIMEFGLANTTTRYVSRCLATKDYEQLKQVIGTSHTIYLIIAVGLLFLGTIFYFCIDPVYSRTLSAEELYIAKQVYLIMLVNITVLIQTNIFTAVINAHEHFIFVRGINLLKIILQPLLVWAILSWKASVLNVVLAQSVCIWGVIIVNYLYCKYKLKLSFPFQFSKTPLFKELTGFSIFIFLHMLMDQVYWKSGQLILGAVSGAAAVAIYAIAMQVATFAVGFPSMMSSVFLPKLSASVAVKNDLNYINTLFCKIGRLQFMLLMLIITGFIFLGKTFLSLWIGNGYGIVYWLVLIIMSGYMFDVIQSIGIAVLQAMKKHAFRAYVYTTMAVLNICLAIPLSKIYGTVGCAVSTAFCLILGTGLAINWYYWRIGINIKQFFKDIGKIFPSIILCIFAIGCLFYIWPLRQTILSFLLHAIVLILIYIVVLWGFVFNEYEKKLFSQPFIVIKNFFHSHLPTVK